MPRGAARKEKKKKEKHKRQNFETDMRLEVLNLHVLFILIIGAHHKVRVSGLILLLFSHSVVSDSL